MILPLRQKELAIRLVQRGRACAGRGHPATMRVLVAKGVAEWLEIGRSIRLTYAGRRFARAYLARP